MHGIASVQVAALLGPERCFGSNLVNDTGVIAEEKLPVEFSFAETEEKGRRKEPSGSQSSLSNSFSTLPK